MSEIERGILSTLIFFNIFQVPATKERILALLYQTKTNLSELNNNLNQLLNQGKIFKRGAYYALSQADLDRYEQKLTLVNKQWQKVFRFYWLLYLLPFVRQISIINSLALNNTNEKSDIDFFVITSPRRLYVARSIIIVILKLFGLYKTKYKVKDRFCFGFYVTKKHQDLSRVLIPGSDPLFAFWFASFLPLYGREDYLEFMKQNQWIYDYLPNFEPDSCFQKLKEPSFILKVIKKTLEIIFWLPAELLEPLARLVHIRHTFSLPENHWPTATTIAEKDILKLHALDPRKDFKAEFQNRLNT
ncbi:MAG: hypothetical protein HYW51_03915 [Candidatus Doudnabacteria bacterium]|nr:hypothetical protein [Candidatus Doudnabacteria bacterium]